MDKHFVIIKTIRYRCGVVRIAKGRIVHIIDNDRLFTRIRHERQGYHYDHIELSNYPENAREATSAEIERYNAGYAFVEEYADIDKCKPLINV